MHIYIYIYIYIYNYITIDCLPSLLDDSHELDDILLPNTARETGY